MKTFALACLVMVCLLSPPVAAQEKEVRDLETPITIDIVKKDIAEVMRFIAQKSGLTITLKGPPKFEVTVMLRDIKPVDALKAVCKAYGLELVEEDGDYIVKRHSDPDALLSVEFEDTPLGDVAIKLGNLSGLNVRVPSNAKDTVTLSVTDQTAVQILRLICDLVDMRLAGANRLLVAGSTVDVRPSLSDTPELDLRRELEEAKSDQESLDMRRQITQVARDGARELGDDASAAAAERDIEKFDGILKALAAEIAEFEAELAKRKQD